MPAPSLGPPTRLAGTPRRRAAAGLAAGLALLGWAAASAQTVTPWVFSTVSVFDLDLYRAVLDRVHAGEGYYAVLRDELPAREYPTHSTFNWRLPTYAWLLGTLPDRSVATVGLLVLSFTAVVAVTHLVLGREVGGPGAVVGAVLLLGGAFGWAVYDPDVAITTEPWCEALLLLSLGAYAAGRGPLGIAAAAAALCLRELVLPYCVVAAGLAWRSGRRGEVRAWAVILAVAAAGYAVHAAAVTRHATGAAPTPSGWLDPSGLTFILRSGVMNVWLRSLWPTAAAVYVTAAVVGLAGWRGETGVRLRLCAAAYLVPLTVVRGWDYWGFIYTPLLVLGFVRSPAALRDAIASARGCSHTRSKPDVVVPRPAVHVDP